MLADENPVKSCLIITRLTTRAPAPVTPVLRECMTGAAALGASQASPAAEDTARSLRS